MPSPGFGLLVLRCADLPRSLRFYGTLGLRFVEEQHGDGPVHHAATLPDGAVLELYPATAATAPERGSPGDVRLGFVLETDAVAPALESLAHDGETILSPTVALDPDGRRVELREK